MGSILRKKKLEKTLEMAKKLKQKKTPGNGGPCRRTATYTYYFIK